MQAIQTKYLRPTDKSGARIKAISQAGSVIVSYDHGASDPHVEAARQLCDRLGWTGTIHRGCLPNGDSVFVFSGDSIRIR